MISSAILSMAHNWVEKDIESLWTNKKPGRGGEEVGEEKKKKRFLDTWFDILQLSQPTHLNTEQTDNEQWQHNKFNILFSCCIAITDRCVTLNVLTNTYKTLKINNANVDYILLNILSYCNLVMNPLQTLIIPVVKHKLWFRRGIFYDMHPIRHIHFNFSANSHQVGLFISMTESPTLSMSTCENLAFLCQENRVKLAKDHLQGKQKDKNEHADCEAFFFSIVCVSRFSGTLCLFISKAHLINLSGIPHKHSHTI